MASKESRDLEEWRQQRAFAVWSELTQKAKGELYGLTCSGIERELNNRAAKYAVKMDQDLWRNLVYSGYCLSCGKEYYPITLGAAKVCQACRDRHQKDIMDSQVTCESIINKLLNINPEGAKKEEEKMGEKTFVVKEGTFKIAPHLSNYARNDAPVMVIRFDGDSVGGFMEVFPLVSLTVYPPDKVSKREARVALILGGHNVIVEEGEYLVIEDGKVYVLDEETFEARYEKVAPLKQVYAPTKKKARK